MRIVIIGGTGNLGTALLRELRSGLSLGHDDEVTVVARRRPVLTEDEPGVAWQEADIGRSDITPLVQGADVVVHLAWLFQPTHRPDLTWQSNVVGTARVLEAVNTAGVPAVVATSSIAAYSPSADQAMVDETWPTHGASTAAYAREKAYVERLLDTFEVAHPGTRVVRLRPAFVFQEQAAAEQRRLFGGPLVPGSLLQPRLVPVLPVPSGLKMQAVHADDVARALRAAIERDVTGAFNLAADEPLTAPELAGLFEARAVSVPQRVVRAALAVGWHTHALPAPPQLFDALMQLPTLSTARARDQLGWAPQRTAQEAVAALLAGLRSGAGGPTPPLAADAGGTDRADEIRTGVGQRDRVGGA